jgi:hypothetical protein
MCITNEKPDYLVFVRCAGTPPLSAANTSQLRPQYARFKVIIPSDHRPKLNFGLLGLLWIQRSDERYRYADGRRVSVDDLNGWRDQGIEPNLALRLA